MRRSRSYLTAGRFWLAMAVGFGLWVAVGFACLFFGQISVAPERVVGALAGGDVPLNDVDVVLMQRVPRIALGLLAGGGLALAGAVFQALLRNPLATPHTLGVSAGGALGAALALSLGWSAPSLGPLPLGPVQFFALAGALANMGIIYAFARRRGTVSPLMLLLAGVTLALVCSALIMFVRFISAPDKLVMVDRWLMGGLDVHGYRSVAGVVPFFLPALALMLCEANALNQLTLGEEVAGARGVNVSAVQTEVFLAGSILTASVVSVAGPIGFVGLIVPHAVRALAGPDHRLLLGLSFFGGGAFLAAADTVARSAFAPSELPVGVLTAMLGGPFFLLLLLSRAEEL